jgi:hypothetical protein
VLRCLKKERWDIVPSGVLGGPPPKADGLDGQKALDDLEQAEQAAASSDESEGGYDCDDATVMPLPPPPCQPPADPPPPAEQHERKNKRDKGDLVVVSSVNDQKTQKKQTMQDADDICATRYFVCMQACHEKLFAGKKIEPTTRFAYAVVLVSVNKSSDDSSKLLLEAVLQLGYPVMKHYSQILWVSCKLSAVGGVDIGAG